MVYLFSKILTISFTGVLFFRPNFFSFFPRKSILFWLCLSLIQQRAFNNTDLLSFDKLFKIK
ncbi:hypothetical protein L3Y34_017848 [Caenorhabditis briggsae]|uniref:Uncharacterized protein n=1 Tax=Caenorhabditis briggsae TaxID=6238 RepID=A0AAE9IUD6_CAEBR|nr:hypothetical protein L3Y34_017848 [Caenorhabditis briggsae]